MRGGLEAGEPGNNYCKARAAEFSFDLPVESSYVHRSLPEARLAAPLRSPRLRTHQHNRRLFPPLTLSITTHDPAAGVSSARPESAPGRGATVAASEHEAMKAQMQEALERLGAEGNRRA